MAREANGAASTDRAIAHLHGIRMRCPRPHSFAMGHVGDNLAHRSARSARRSARDRDRGRIRAGTPSPVAARATLPRARDQVETRSHRSSPQQSAESVADDRVARSAPHRGPAGATRRPCPCGLGPNPTASSARPSRSAPRIETRPIRSPGRASSRPNRETSHLWLTAIHSRHPVAASAFDSHRPRTLAKARRPTSYCQYRTDSKPKPSGLSEASAPGR